VNEKKKVRLVCFTVVYFCPFVRSAAGATLCIVWKMSKVFRLVMFTSAIILIVWSVFLISCQYAGREDYECTRMYL